MAISPDELGIRFESLLLLNGGMTLAYQWEVYHKSWVPDTVIDTGTIWQKVAKPGQFSDADAALQDRLATTLRGVKDQHKPIGTVGSFHDVTLIWQNWTFSRLSDGQLQASHPLSGTFTGAAENTPLGRTQALLSIVLPPPAWTWADSPGVGQLRTKAMTVAGAASYKVYADLGGGTFELLGNVPSAGLNTIPVEPGSYNVRLAAVAGNGRVGILGNAVTVTVEGAAAAPDTLLMDEPRVPEPRVPEPVVAEGPELSRGDRFVRWLWGAERYDGSG